MNPNKLYQWVKKSSKQWKGTTRHFQKSVTEFSRGVVMAQSSQIRQISSCIGGKPNSQRRRLQRFLANEQSLALFVSGWTRSVLKQVRPQEVVLIVDETKLRKAWGVMVIGLAYHERCIPLAWEVYRANDAAAYPSEGQVGMILRLLGWIQAGVPKHYPVRVLADRGIGTSPDLMRGVMAMGWTFLFRVTRMSKIILPDGSAVTFYDQVTHPGAAYQASGLVFKKRGRIPAHVRVLWGPDAQERWALVTNDPTLTGWEYAERMWIEEAFRDLKSHGWQLETAQLDAPQRMARLWIILVVAYTWMLLIGFALEAAQLVLPPKRCPDGTYVRRWSLFREGCRWFRTFCPPLRI
jgi:hypothetical protein